MKKYFKIIIYAITFILLLVRYNIVLAANQVDSEYIKLLENVNQQLSYRWSFINVVLILITVIVAIIAVSSAYILYMQNKEYKERLNETIEKYSKEYTKRAKKTLVQLYQNQRTMLKIYQSKTQKLDKNIELIKKEYRKELAKIKATPDEKKRFKMLEEKLEKLINEKENLTSAYGVNVSPTTTPYISNIGLGANVRGFLSPRLCIYCNKPLPSDNRSGLCSDCQNWPVIPPGNIIS